MTWGQWIAAMVAAIAGSVLAVSYYLHWGARYRVRLLGLVAETAFLLLLVALDALAMLTVWRLHP